MPLKKEQRELIKHFILHHVKDHPHDIVKYTAACFDLSRQAIHNYVKKLEKEGALEIKGTTSDISYKLKETEIQFEIDLGEDIKEDVVWRNKVAPGLSFLGKNVFYICNYGFTEMLNNAIDHSGSRKVLCVIQIDPINIKMIIVDYGIGIFNKIQKELGLEDARHAILELAKGKLTTDPRKHTGEGIYFTSRMFDSFDILSDNIYFHGHKDDDWLMDKDKINTGTAVFMEISRETTKTAQEVFDESTLDDENAGFLKTKVPVKLLKHEGEELISRSQAKRLLARFDKFREVILDFDGIKTIGQPFADEVFRVFRAQQPDTNLTWVNANDNVSKTIRHVLGQ